MVDKVNNTVTPEGAKPASAAPSKPFFTGARDLHLAKAQTDSILAQNAAKAGVPANEGARSTYALTFGQLANGKDGVTLAKPNSSLESVWQKTAAQRADNLAAKYGQSPDAKVRAKVAPMAASDNELKKDLELQQRKAPKPIR